MVARSILLSLFFLVSAPLLIYADFYKFHDDSGGANVTNDYNSIPERYRAGVIVVKDADLEKKSQAREKHIRSERQSLEHQRRRSETVKQTQTSPETASTVTIPINEKAEAVPTNALSTKSPGWFGRQLPFLKVTALIVLFIAIAAVAGKLISSLVPRTLGVLIRIALFAGVIVYVFNAYSEKVAKAYAVLKSETEVVQKAVDKRSERIDRQTEAH